MTSRKLQFIMLVTQAICNQLSDLEVVKKALVELDYFSCLYQRYELNLLRYIKRIASVTSEEAEDILQEAFIKIWRNLHDFDPHLKLSSWIYRIVHNETISFWRHSRSFGKNRQVALDDQISENLPGDFEQHESGDQKEQSTREILELLPLKYRSVLLLKFMAGMSYEEISDVLKIPEGTVATRINRAKRAFAKMAEEKHTSFVYN